MRTLSTSTTTKLFATGFTVGPIVDSLHNQCLLRYDFLPISLEWPGAAQHGNVFGDIAVRSSITSNVIADGGFHAYPYLFCSSWIVPPLLGFAYVVLGGLLPRIAESILESLQSHKREEKYPPAPPPSELLRTRALLAVTTTAMIIKLSEFLETHPGFFDDSGVLYGQIETSSLPLLVMIVASISQWALLDQSIVALLLATVTAVGGPLAELPFVGHGAWTYIERAADYFPLQNLPPTTLMSTASTALFGTSNYQDLALSSITGPCYFAVAMDAIALGRWFDSSTSSSSLEEVSSDGSSM